MVRIYKERIDYTVENNVLTLPPVVCIVYTVEPTSINTYCGH